MSNGKSVIVDQIPEYLRSRRQWVMWAYRDTGRDKPTKVPYRPTDTDGHAKADPTNPDHWSAFDAVHDYYVSHSDDISGVGIALRQGGDLVGIDLDGCVTDGVIESWAQEVIDLVDSYAELSPSGRGVRIFALSPLPAGWRKCGPIEVYDCARYLTVTGRRISTAPTVNERPGQVGEFHRRFGPPVAERPAKSPTVPVVDRADEWVLERCRVASNHVKFEKLWSGDWRALGYPSQSEADAALVFLLSFWTQCPGQIDRLFRVSGLYRPKWDAKRGAETYGSQQIQRALATRSETYTPPDLIVRRLESKLGERTQVQIEDVTDDNPTNQPKVKLMGLSEFCRRAKSAPQNWIIPGWLGAGECHIFSGREKTGKSTLTFHTVCSLLSGSDWFGLTCAKRPVLYFDFENPCHYTARNIEQGLSHLELSPDDVDAFWHTPDLLPGGLTADYVADCIQSTGRSEGVVFIDSGRAAFGPLTTVPDWENKSSEVARFVRPLTRLAHETGWSIILVHHNAKSDSGPAGSGDWGAGVDHIWTYRVTSSGARQLQFRGRVLEDTPDLFIGKEGSRLVLDIGLQPARVEQRLDELSEDRQFRSALSADPTVRATTKELIAALGWDKRRVLAAGKRLHAERKVARHDGRKVTDGYTWSVCA